MLSKYRKLFAEENILVTERYELTMERIKALAIEEAHDNFSVYFQQVAKFIVMTDELKVKLEQEELEAYSTTQHKELNHLLHEDILGNRYEISYANPKYALEQLGKEYGPLLAYLYTEIRSNIIFAYEFRHAEITRLNELFLEVYSLFSDGLPKYSLLQDCVEDHMKYYCRDIVFYRTRESLDPNLSFITDIIVKEDLNDLSYLYKFGEYISDNEIKIASYLNSLPQEKIDEMAATYTEGYQRGFINSKIDLSKKKTVNIRYTIGFERVVKKAIENFKALGLSPIIYRYALLSMNKRPARIGFTGISANKQYDYDHRFDIALYFTKDFSERRLDALKSAYETYKDLANDFAGPALIEVFGEEPFAPENKEAALALSTDQQALYVEHSSRSSQISNEYIKGNEISFTIIAYPIPEIGDRFEEIFNDTIKVNTLDQDHYRELQQSIIDTLDLATHVTIIGKGKNKTNLSVSMQPLVDPATQSNFENCLADVNIPVGEVFTSPQLKGTNGVLHVPEVFLRELKFIDLTLTFKDGMIETYDCKNFEDKEANQKFIKENLLYNHETLPIGEFAIGTNTTAYVMANKYNILHILPILIVEKMGPHFAVGDTCFSWREDFKVYNPNGKEIVARDNECSILRKTNINEAYFNCHTDITIPYDEIQEIAAVTIAGDKLPIIQDGRFVLKGTEYLNEAFQ